MEHEIHRCCVKNHRPMSIKKQALKVPSGQIAPQGLGRLSGVCGTFVSGNQGHTWSRNGSIGD